MSDWTLVLFAVVDALPGTVLALLASRDADRLRKRHSLPQARALRKDTQ